MNDQEHYWRHMLPLHKLRALCAAERQRALKGHWTYDVAWHAHMLRVYREREALEDHHEVAH